MESVKFSDERIVESYELIRHKSGLLIYLFPKQMTTAYALFATKFGSVDTCFRLEGETDFSTVPDGIAHFLEHKMFESEDGTDAFTRFAAVGANANAYTTNSTTAYLFSCTEGFNEALAELLHFVMHPHFTKENVKKEQGIIAQEIQMYEDSPGNVLYMQLLAGLYQKHRVRNNIAGTCDSIQEITPELLYRCYRGFYRPDNMILAICGSFSREEVLALVDQEVPCLPPEKVERDMPKEPKEIANAYLEKRMSIARPMIAIGVKDTFSSEDPVLRERRCICMDILNDLMFGKTSAFYHRLSKEGVISDDFSADYDLLSTCAYNSFFCECDDPERIFAEIRQEVLCYQRQVPAREDFERLRRCYYVDYLRAFDSTEDIANALVSSACRGFELFRSGQLILDVTYEELLSVMADFYSSPEYVRSVILPVEEEEEHE